MTMRPMLLVFRRELAGYFATPVAAVFLIVFLALSAGMAFLVSGFFDRGQADLSGFFFWHPWLYLVLMPAIAMRLWAEERRSGTIEILMTLPVEVWQIVLGKWLAAWAFAALALLLTMPLWITVNILGSPDNGVILASYLGSWLMAGAFLALSAAISGVTKSQILAFIGATAVSFLFVMAGYDLVISLVRSWAPEVVIDAVRSMSFLGHFQRITEGVLELPSIVFFISLIVFCLWLNIRVIEVKKAA
jgi:ABC-2 type transport system permease protein